MTQTNCRNAAFRTQEYIYLFIYLSMLFIFRSYIYVLTNSPLAVMVIAAHLLLLKETKCTGKGKCSPQIGSSWAGSKLATFQHLFYMTHISMLGVYCTMKYAHPRYLVRYFQIFGIWHYRQTSKKTTNVVLYSVPR